MSEFVETTLDAGQTVTVSLSVIDGCPLYVVLDDGSGGQPATYDIGISSRVDGFNLSDESAAFSAFQTVFTASGSTAPYHEVTSVPDEMQVQITNQSGAPATYRVRITAGSE